MRIPKHPPVGSVIAYEYLWQSQRSFREDGAKIYPAAIVFALLRGEGEEIAYVLGISHSPPLSGQSALPIPPKLKRYLGLDEQPSWIYTDQLNIFAWPGPDLRPASTLSTRPHLDDTCVIGQLPEDWFESVKQHLEESRRQAILRVVKRTE